MALIADMRKQMSLLNRKRVIGAVTGVALLGAGAGASLASSTTVAQAIRAQDSIIEKEPGYGVVGELSTLKIKSYAQARTLVKQLDALDAEMNHAAAVVSGVPTTSSAQKTGETDWVDGVQKLADGVQVFATALTDIANGEKVSISSVGGKIASQDLAAGKLTNAADKLLGLPAGY